MQKIDLTKSNGAYLCRTWIEIAQKAVSVPYDTRKGRACTSFSMMIQYRVLLLDVGQLQSVPLALVLLLEGEGEKQCYDTETSEYAHGQGIVILLEYLSVDDTLATDAVLIEQPADEQGYEA